MSVTTLLTEKLLKTRGPLPTAPAIASDQAADNSSAVRSADNSSLVRSADNSSPVRSADNPFAIRSGATVLRVVRDHAEFCQDQLAEEVPVALIYNGQPYGTMLASPDRLEELALGFSLSEGIVDRASDLSGISVSTAANGVELHLTIASSCLARLHAAMPGAAPLDQLAGSLHPVLHRGPPVAAGAIARALQEMQEQQDLHRATGAVHAIAWATPAGEVKAVREDVGRHAALDKLIGYLAGNSVDPAAGFALSSSRVSYEMVQKAVRAGIGMLAAASAPTALAVRLAKDNNLTLIGFARGYRLVVYSHQDYLLTGDGD